MLLWRGLWQFYGLCTAKCWTTSYVLFYGLCVTMVYFLDLCLSIFTVLLPQNHLFPSPYLSRKPDFNNSRKPTQQLTDKCRSREKKLEISPTVYSRNGQ